MQIESKCPGCSRTLRVPAEHAGKTARCPVCSTIYNIPAADQPVPDPAAASDRWYLQIPEGQTYGPVPRSVLDEWVQEGRVSDDCRLLLESEGAWQDAAAVYPALRPPPAQPMVVPAFDNPLEVSSGPLRTGSPGGRVVNPHRGGLVLTLGILSWALGCTILGVLAWVIGSSDLRDMRHGIMDTRGMGLTQAGQIIGMVQVVLSLIFLVGMLFAMIVLGILN